MKSKLAIITPTHNRRKLLEKLYISLLNQTNKKFVWVVVNDGSNDDTDELVKKLILEDKIEIRYKNQKNSGKGMAVNAGLDMSLDLVFALIVDDDEILYKNAVDTVIKYVEMYQGTCCGGIEFRRDDSSGHAIGNYNKNDFFMGIQLRKRLNYYIDGYTGYFIDKVRDLRAPHFQNESYIGPGVLQTLVGNESELLWPNVSIGTTEYLEGGLTKKGKPLRFKNPMGMIYYSVLMQSNESGRIYNFLYSVLGYAYCVIGHVRKSKLKINGIEIEKLSKFAIVPGYILACLWKIKYSIQRKVNNCKY